MLKDHDTQMEIFDVDYRPWPIHEKMQTWLNKRDAVQVVKCPHQTQGCWRKAEAYRSRARSFEAGRLGKDKGGP